MGLNLCIAIFISCLLLALIGLTGIAARILRQAEVTRVGVEMPKNAFGWIPFLLANAILFITHILAGPFSSLHPIEPPSEPEKVEAELPPDSVRADDSHFNKDDLLQIKDEVMRDNWRKEKIVPTPKRPADMPWRLSNVENPAPEEKHE